MDFLTNLIQQPVTLRSKQTELTPAIILDATLTFLLEFLTTYLGTYLIHAGIVVIKILELHSHATLKYGTFIG